jgi:glutamate dehydrogenase (NAD(P)+)
MLPEVGLKPEQCTFSVLGFGNVGSWSGKIFQDKGAKMIAVADHTGFIRNEKGIDANDLAEYVAQKGGVGGVHQGERDHQGRVLQDQGRRLHPRGP